MGDIVRIGCLSNRYSKIAMIHYADAKQQAEKILEIGELSDEVFLLSNMFENNVIVTVTFVAMALESFFNDYAARKFGDSFYQDNFEILRPTGKMQLIAKFVFGKEINKGDCLFQLVANVFRLRNEYVHNKSKDGREIAKTEEEIAVFEERIIVGEDILVAKKQETSNELKKAFESVKALCEVARFFEESDLESYAMFFLVSANVISHYDSVEFEKIFRVQKEFKISPIIEASDL